MIKKKLVILELCAILLCIILYGIGIRTLQRHLCHGLLRGWADDRYYNAKLACTEDYDAIFMGTSLSQNFKCSELDSMFETNSIKFTFSGGRLSELSSVFNLASSKRNIKMVVLEMESFLLFGQMRPFPYELYGKNQIPRIIRDIKETLSIPPIFEIIHGIRKGGYGQTRDSIYAWQGPNVCSEVNFARYVINECERTPIHETEPNEMYVNKSQVCMDTYLKPLLEKTKEAGISIYCFFPPTHIMSYKTSWATEVEIKRKLYEILLKYPNVKLYDFSIAKNIVRNANLYRDLMHYDGSINSWMLKQMLEEHFIVTPDNSDDYLLDFQNTIKNYDYTQEYERLAKLISVVNNKKID